MIVDGYVSLGDRQSLEQLREHRRKLAECWKMSLPWSSGPGEIELGRLIIFEAVVLALCLRQRAGAVLSAKHLLTGLRQIFARGNPDLLQASNDPAGSVAPAGFL